MNGRDYISFEDNPLQGSLPERFEDGGTVLVACAGDPSQAGICLRLLGRSGDAEHTALVVTTTVSAAETIETYEDLTGVASKPSLRLVDTASQQQSISAIYDEIPVVFTPAQRDLERLVVALSELTGTNPPANGSRHLVVRSLTPILDESSTSQVCAVLERITGLRSDDALGLLGLDYTAHDETTMTSLADQVDGILWVQESKSGDLQIEYSPARARPKPPVPGGDDDD